MLSTESLLEQQRSELERRESERRYRELFEGSRDGIVMVDANGRILDANRAYCDMLGYSVAELRELPDFYAITPERWRQWEHDEIWCRRLLESGHSGLYEKEYIRKNGEVFPVELQCFAVFDSERRPRYLWGICRDISRRKCSETERMALEQQLRHAHKMQAVGTLAGGIAHDFNNILAAVLGFAELAMVDAGDTPGVQHSLHEVVKGCERAKDLVRQILTFGRRAEPQLRPVLVQRIAREVLQLLHASIPAGVEARDHIDPDCPPVLADPVAVHQVIMNLCANAFHAMRDCGGVLELRLTRVSSDDLREPRTELRPGKSYVVLSVRDTGRGVDSEQLERIFEPYFTTKLNGEGTGLGLALVHSIVSSHGGATVATSEPGQGCTFEVYLPVLEPSSERTGDRAGAPRPELRGTERVLLVDDEAALARIVSIGLGRLGYTVTSCQSGEEAVALFARQPSAFDLVISDVTMPGMTGLQLTEEVLRRRRDLPVILWTGYSELVSSEEVSAAGARTLLIKPLTPRQLAGAIRDHLS